MSWYNPFSWGKKRSKEDIKEAQILEQILPSINDSKTYLEGGSIGGAISGTRRCITELQHGMQEIGWTRLHELRSQVDDVQKHIERKNIDKAVELLGRIETKIKERLKEL